MPNPNEPPAVTQSADNTPSPPEPRDFEEMTRQTLKDVHKGQPGDEPPKDTAGDTPPPSPTPDAGADEPPALPEGVPEGATVLNEEAAWEKTYVPTNVNGKIVMRKLSELRASTMMEADYKEKSAANKEREGKLEYARGVMNYLSDNPTANDRLYAEATKYYAARRAGTTASDAPPPVQEDAPPAVDLPDEFEIRTEFKDETDFTAYQKSFVEHVNKQNKFIKQLATGGGHASPPPPQPQPAGTDPGMAEFRQAIQGAQQQYDIVQKTLESEMGAPLDLEEFRDKVSKHITAQRINSSTAVKSILTAPGWLEQQARAAYKDDLEKAAAESERLARDAATRKAAGEPGLGASGREPTSPGKFPTLEKDKKGERYDFEGFTRKIIKSQTAGGG